MRIEMSEADQTEKVMVVLRDGRKLLGIFRSYDQYGEFILAARSRMGRCADLASSPHAPFDSTYALLYRDDIVPRPIDRFSSANLHYRRQPTSCSSRQSRDYTTDWSTPTEISVSFMTLLE